MESKERKPLIDNSVEMDRIGDSISWVCGIEFEDLKSKERRPHTTTPRHLAIYCCYHAGIEELPTNIKYAYEIIYLTIIKQTDEN